MYTCTKRCKRFDIRLKQNANPCKAYRISAFFPSRGSKLFVGGMLRARERGRGGRKFFENFFSHLSSVLLYFDNKKSFASDFLVGKADFLTALRPLEVER